jgi:hypothetical protein
MSGASPLAAEADAPEGAIWGLSNMSHGNKYLFLVAALALAAPVLYQYGPDFTRDVEQAAAQKAEIAAAVAATVLNSQAAQSPTVRPTAAATSLQVLKESTSDGERSSSKNTQSSSKKFEKPSSKDSQKPARRIDRKSSAVSPQPQSKKVLEAPPALKPATAAETSAEISKDRMVARRESSGRVDRVLPLENPRDKRWLNGLTGSRVQFSAERQAMDDACAKRGTCEPLGNSESVSVVGVVVDAEKLERLPMGQGGAPLIQGKVRQGHWSDNKPVVYMQ